MDNEGVVEFKSSAPAEAHASDELLLGDANGLVLVPSPAVRFTQLAKDTDLNLSPTAKQRRVHHEYLSKLHGMGEPQMSLRFHGGRVELAGCGYECASAPPPTQTASSTDADVHFLGPAENIKTLFKLPYSRSRVSLAIHRVGNTLVVDGDVDEKDLPKGFDECNEVLRIGDAAQFQPRPLLEAGASELYENFIYQSTQLALSPPALPPASPANDDDDFAAALAAASVEPPARPPKTKLSAKEKKRRAKLKKQQAPCRPPSATPDVGDDGPLPNVVPAFQRILKWKFHDMQMILGSDVQLFSNKDHPAVSLKLHDADKDLSLCTVLDYYLDNVIANIPELAICMHSKGHVRGYQLVETRDIPYLNGSTQPLFDIHDVNLNATMLFKFLQHNCSEPNGTYWLYRAEGDYSLRLYDVRMLSQGKQRKWKYMMAMLCYRFASRAARLVSSAFEAPALQARLRHRQRELLGTCLELLGELREDQPGSRAQDSISASVAEQMADTYLRELDDAMASGDQIAHLRSATQHLQQSIRMLEHCVADHVAERARKAAEGLPLSETMLQPVGDTDVDADDDYDNDDTVGLFMEEEVQRLRLKHAAAALRVAVLYVESHAYADALRSLHDACGFLRLDALPLAAPIAPVTAIGFFERLVSDLDFGGVGHAKATTKGPLKPLYSADECRASVLEVIGDLASSRALGRDLALAVALTHALLAGSLTPATATTLADAFVPRAFQALLREAGAIVEPLLAEDGLHLAFYSYLRALSPPVHAEHYLYVRPAASRLRHVLVKKLGNAANETGKHYLKAKELHRACLWFEGGSLLFEAIEDGVNAALLCANLANLHKILAESEDQDGHYAQSIALCVKAQGLLRQSKGTPEVQAKVTGELALTYLVWAVRLSLSAPVPPDVEARAAAKFNKALHLYIEVGDARQVASTHYQMASFYSRQLLAKPDATSRTKMELARRHYEKALQYFGAVELGKTFVIIHQELAGLYAASDKAEDIEHALLVLLNTFDAYEKEARLPADERAALAAVAPAILESLQTYLLRIMRATGATKAVKARMDVFKQMYKEALVNRDAPLAQVLLALRNLYT
ncbi:hypothetical protein ACHHYP_12306 [Achlya hypogyna]|uniref:Erythroid differentiation-related factor 1 n=1 Tax=Achlya hypogyna TaxID=1202772 RepID=A0A1V9ZGV9_ACHHY|nr:hypothetical protein ACHHYP_12306 [Achlya hypogyna]